MDNTITVPDTMMTYKCGCDKATLRLLMMTEKDYIKSYNEIIDVLNELYVDAEQRNMVVADQLLGSNNEMVIKPESFNITIETNETIKRVDEVKLIKIVRGKIVGCEDSSYHVVFEFITDKGTFTHNDINADAVIDLNNILECTVKTIHNKLYVESNNTKNK